MFLIDFADESVFPRSEETMCVTPLNLGGRNEALWEKVTKSTVRNEIKN